MPGQGQGSGFTHVERFIREVLPTRDGPHRIATTHHSIDLIGRAAEERGLTSLSAGGITWFHAGRTAVGGVRRPMRTTLTGQLAATVCESKYFTVRMLQAAGLPTAPGLALGQDQVETALAHVHGGGRWVVKPADGKKGRGITLGIETESGLRAAWDVARRAAGPSTHLVLERLIDGIDLRVFVVGRRAVGVTTRLPAYVVGDGRRTIAELTAARTEARASNAYLATIPVRVDTEFLARAGWTTVDVPDDDEIVLLNGTGNVDSGSDNVDLTDILHPDLVSLAVAATRCMPGLGLAGVDLMAPGPFSADGAVVLEVNAYPDVAGHHYPAFGEPRDVAGTIVDEMMRVADHGSAVADALTSAGANGALIHRPGQPQPVERFVREVLPSLRGGPREEGMVRRDVQLIRRAAKDRGLSTIEVGDVRYFHDDTVAMGGVRRPRTTTLAGEIALDVCRSPALTAQLLRAAGLPTSSDDAVRGLDLRVLVVGGRAIAAVARLPAYVVGDGHRRITELIHLKELRRPHQASAANKMVVDAQVLFHHGRTLDDVPAADEVVVLNGTVDPASGGETIDVTELAHLELLRLAVDAARVVPGLCVAGVDLVVDDLGSADGALVRSIDATPGLRMHHYPAVGTPRDAAGAIVTQMIATTGRPTSRRPPRPRSRWTRRPSRLPLRRRPR